MHKSIFVKYFALFSSLIIVCVIVLGLVFSYSSFIEIKTREHSFQINNLKNCVKEIQINYVENDNKFDFDSMEQFFQIMSYSSTHMVFITDINGNITYYAQLVKFEHLQDYITTEILDSVLKVGEYTEYGYLGKIYSERLFNAGLPIYNEDELIGFIFSTSSATLDTEDNYILSLVQAFILCAIFAVGVTCFIVYFITYQMVKPLREMSDASKSFAVGDFSAKISVNSTDEIGQLALALNNMAQALEVSENAHKNFVANVSHELRTPMTSISGFVDGILDGTIPKERHVHYLNIVSDETKRLSRLVRTMLNLSRIENGELQIETARVNIVDIVCETVFSFEREIERKNIKLEGLDHDKVFVVIDYDLIHQVIYNLTENAIKFVDEGGYIKFTYIHQSDSTIIGIENSGVGISKAEMPRVFDRFYKTDGSRGIDKNGVGLGLHIVRSIVNLHGGEVMVRSVENEYCHFSFNLPNPKNTFEL